MINCACVLMADEWRCVTVQCALNAASDYSSVWL